MHEKPAKCTYNKSLITSFFYDNKMEMSCVRRSDTTIYKQGSFTTAFDVSDSDVSVSVNAEFVVE